MFSSHHIFIIQFLIIGFIQSGLAWSRTNHEPTGKLKDLDVICGKDHMTVRAEFDGPFNGIVSSKGSWGQGNCVYIKSHSGVQHATFKVMYNECGTKPDLQGKYYENTIVIQYGTDIIEAMDEAKRLRCEWFEAYEKPATFRPAIPVADLDVVEMNFQGDDIDCWMEIQEGKGPWSRPVNRIVPVGQPMTIVIAIADQSSQFDMRVKSCFAHDGVKPPVQLTDEYGCVLRKSMLSEFSKIRGQDYRKNLEENAVALNGYLGKATVISYAHFYAFKFPDSMSVQMQCTVEVCRNGCPSACQKGYYPPPTHVLKPKISFNQSPSLSRKLENPNTSENHSHDLNSKQNENYPVLDEDISLAASESNQQNTLAQNQNQRRQLTDETSDNNSLSLVTELNEPVYKEDQSKLNNTPVSSQPFLRMYEDSLQHESSKLISELKLAGMDLNRLTETLLNTPKNSKNKINKANSHSILDNLPNLSSHIQRLQNDHLEKVFQNERLRELALESGMKLNHFNELLPQAQPLVKNNDNSSIDFDNLLNSVNSLTSHPIVSTTSTTTPKPSSVSLVTEFYLDEETTVDSQEMGLESNEQNYNENASSKNQDNEEKNLEENQIPKNIQPIENLLKHKALNQPKVENNLPPNIPFESLLKTPYLNKPNLLNSRPKLNNPSLSQIQSQLSNLQQPQLSNLQQPQLLNLQPNHLNKAQLSKNKLHQQALLSYQNGQAQFLPANFIQPLIHHQHHQPLHFQYSLQPAFNNLPINFLPNSQQTNVLSVKNPTTKQKSKLANLFKQNSLTQYGYSLLQSFKKDNQNNNLNPGLLSNMFGTSMFPAGPRSLRIGRSARMQLPNKINNLLQQKKTEPKIRQRRSIGSHVNLQQQFKVVTPLDMQFNEDQELTHLPLNKLSSNSKKTNSLICVQLKSTFIFALIASMFLFIILIFSFIFVIKKQKTFN